MRGLALYLVVALAGGAVLALEILGTRLLGPFYGVSLYLWSALISVTLAALSLGYFLGGAWADRGPTPRRLSGLLLAAGLWIFAIPLLRDPLLGSSEGLGLRAAVLATATGLFFPPLALLGMVSPYAIRLSARDLGEVGRTAGNLYAVSTVASVVAALLTGFLLIPRFGVLRLTLAIGIVLLVAAWIAFAAGGSRRSAAAALVLLGLAYLGLERWAISAESAPVSPAGRVLFRGHSPYAELCVLERGGLRYFLIDGGIHSVVEIESGETRHPYVVVAELACELFAEPGQMLLVGLGGGSTAKTFTWNGWRVEAVEIDSLVTRVAHDHFGLEPFHARVLHMDGRRYLRQPGESYDLIFLDAFGSSSIPFHLVTEEAFTEARGRLRPGGVVAVNVEAVGWDHVLVRSLAATLRRRFERVLVLPIAEPPDRLGNLVLLAGDREMAISDEALGSPVDHLADEYQHWRSLVRNHAWDNRFEPPAEGALVLTDDRNPVDLWSEEINRAARLDLHRSFGRGAATGFGWR